MIYVKNQNKRTIRAKNVETDRYTSVIDILS